jgi:sporulation protein YlmC with PRC-barrel domain
MRSTYVMLLASIALAVPSISRAQVAGSTVVAREIATGWSVKHQIIGQPVFNDKEERVGSVDDIIIAPNKAVTYAIINAGGFIGLTKHDVAIPVSEFKMVDNKLILAGATKEALKAKAPFEYTR